MEEQMLTEKKLNIIQRLQKSFIMRRLSRDRDFGIWEQIKSPALKYDLEIMDKAGDIAIEDRNSEEYGKLPKEIQIEKGRNLVSKFSIDGEFKRSLDEDVQYEMVKRNYIGISDCKLSTKIKLATEQPEEFIPQLASSEKQEFMKALKENEQVKFIKKNPELLLYTSDEIKQEVLNNEEVSKEVSIEDLQRIISKEGSSSIKRQLKWIEMSKRKYFGVDELIIANFVNNSDENVVKKIQELDNEDKMKVCNILKTTCRNKEISQLAEQQLFDTILQNYKIGTLGFHVFRAETINNIFEQKYGTEKFIQYKAILNEYEKQNNEDGITYNIHENVGNRLFDLVFKENTIIEKVEPSKVIDYIQTLEQYEDERAKRGDKPKPLGEKVTEKLLHQKLTEIIRDAYGEKAANIVKNRPGLKLDNIANTEIFSKEITENFREGFIHDLLSYKISGMEEFMQIRKNPEELNAFKLYYDRMSAKLGENVVTMQACMQRYNEFSEILKQASISELTEMQLEQLDNLCAWPKNICKITQIEELDGLSQRLENEIMKEMDLKEKEEFCRTTQKRDSFGINIKSETVIYDYLNLPEEEMKNLSKEEKKLMKFFQENKTISLLEDKCAGKDIDSTWVYSLNLELLRKACKQGIDISSIFLNQSSARVKIKEEQIQKFNGELTNRKAIEQAQKEGKYGVKIINVDGVEFIDLGTMPVNFASHKPGENNSGVLVAEEEYLEYDGDRGMSTISARPKSEIFGNGYEDRGNYVYWNFEDNEVISLMNESLNDKTDGMVSHSPKLAVSNGNANRSVRGYRKMEAGTEIAFYRRHRNHERIEQEKYGGKIVPDAIFGEINTEDITFAQQNFGRPIPIILGRGDLKNKNIEDIQKVVAEAKEKMQEEQEQFREEAKRHGLEENLEESYKQANIGIEDIKEAHVILREEIQKDKNKNLEGERDE